MTKNKALPEGFKLITCEDAAVFKKYTGDRGGKLSCEYAFANLLAWNSRFKMAYLETEGQLWVYGSVADFLYFPLGRQTSPEQLIEWSRKLQQQGRSGNLGVVPIEFYQQHADKFAPLFTWHCSPDYYDYVYLTEDLAELPGQKLSAKRNLISQFMRDCADWRSRPMVEERDKEQVLALAQVWAADKTPNEQIRADLQALKDAFKCWDRAGFAGTLLEVKGELIAFAIHSMMTDDMADVHFEKAIYNCKGSAQMINRETAAQLRDKAKWINREQDLGVPGLRHAKLSYDPEYLIEVGLLKTRIN